MSDAVERVRTAASLPDHVMDGFVMVQTEHLRELLALHDEAVRVVQALEDSCAAVASWSSECIDYNEPERVAARAFLAKAGGK